ncbi:hypothetical protein AVEN_271208-1 [Araneus ventricosus]|uniref:Uncharacterized protein n=1 Tax=Araneus ventricosus TaxID=182803 RepID=A0A4Y2MEF4_ARAVE|nr:hypothetical protein AVEN_271208-1 [Araneus ventricosus]
MARTTPELATPLQTSAPRQRRGHLATTYDLVCNRPHSRHFLSRIGFRTWFLAPNRDLTTRPPRPPDSYGVKHSSENNANIVALEGAGLE